MRNKFYELQFEIETNCLLNCIHCSSIGSRGKERSYSDENILRFLQCFPGAVHIYFTGGEPLLYKNLLPLCREIRDKKGNATIGLYSTGVCADVQPVSNTFAKELQLAGVQDCFFSIYSNLSEEHDAWTGHTGSLQCTLSSARHFSDAGIVPKTHLVLTRENQHKMDDVIRFCQTEGMEEIRILRLAPSGNAKANWGKIGIPLPEQNELIKRLVLERDRYHVRMTFAGYPTLHPCRSFPGAQQCQAGTNLLYVDALGDLYPCACVKQEHIRHRLCSISDLDAVSDYLRHMAELECHSTCFNEEYMS